MGRRAQAVASSALAGRAHVWARSTLARRRVAHLLIFLLLPLTFAVANAGAGQIRWGKRVELSALQAGQTPPGILYPPLPINMSLPTYDYSAPETCAGCHFILGLDHTARAFGVIWDAQSQTWDLTGSGWLASDHAQSDHGSTENAFCAKCHSPLEAAAVAGFDQGTVTNANPVPQQRFQAVTCATCHPPDNITAILGALNPNAIDGGAIAIYLWKGYNNPSSYQTLNPGQDDLLCLNCHEQRHNTSDSAFAAMYAAGVRCVDCHMAAYQYVGGGNTGLPQLAERFHDWKVGTNLPYSCGAQGALPGQFSCHSSFTVTDAQDIIPFIRQQHSAWWTLQPFNNQPQVAVLSAHGVMNEAQYAMLWREIAKVNADAVH